MKTSELITRLMGILSIHGDIPIYHAHDSVEYVPMLEVSTTVLVQDDGTFEYKEVTVPKRALIK